MHGTVCCFVLDSEVLRELDAEKSPNQPASLPTPHLRSSQTQLIPTILLLTQRHTDMTSSHIWTPGTLTHSHLLQLSIALSTPVSYRLQS